MSIPLARLTPISNIAPFTYRDGATFLELLEAIKGSVKELITNESAQTASIAALIDEVSRLVAEFSDVTADVEEVKSNIARFRAELLALIAEATNVGTAYNPVYGREADSVNRVNSDIYDNARIYAYFASEFDELDRTALEIDSLNMSARMFDLAPDTVIRADNSSFTDSFPL